MGAMQWGSLLLDLEWEDGMLSSKERKPEVVKVTPGLIWKAGSGWSSFEGLGKAEGRETSEVGGRHEVR